MDLLLILTYTAICIGAFKLFKIPVNAMTLLTAALGGVFLIGFLLLGMNYNHPFSSKGRFYFYTTPIVPVVRGMVIEAPVKGGTQMKKGDVLFKIDPTRYAAIVDEKEAALAEANQTAKQLTSRRKSSEARVEQSKADSDRNRIAYERVEKLGSNAVSQQEIDTKRGLYYSALATLAAAEADLESAILAETSQIDGVNTAVARLQAELAAAQYDLDQTVVRAPSDGTVEQSFLREGMMAVPLPLKPVMVFTPAEPPSFAGAFLQNSAQRLYPGAHAEVVFPAVPGRVFQAKVTDIQEAIAQGQLQPNGALLDPESVIGHGRVIVKLDIEGDLDDYLLVPGTEGIVAVYTEHFHHLAIIRKVLIRMKSWTNYLFSDGH